MGQQEERKIRTIKYHELKTLPQYFNQVSEGIKNFEIRIDDRDIQTGDYVKLREWTPESGYTGKTTEWLHIVYLLRNVPEYGLREGYCIFCWDKKLIIAEGKGAKM